MLTAGENGRQLGPEQGDGDDVGDRDRQQPRRGPPLPGQERRGDRRGQDDQRRLGHERGGGSGRRAHRETAEDEERPEGERQLRAGEHADAAVVRALEFEQRHGRPSPIRSVHPRSNSDPGGQARL
ncbi:MAG: hypothetical protein PGN24_12340 [Microbacterium arborescens]